MIKNYKQKKKEIRQGDMNLKNEYKGSKNVPKLYYNNKCRIKIKS